MSDPRMEDHAVGVELQITELVEKRERALIQGRTDRAEELLGEIEVLQAELAATAEQIAGEHFDHAHIVEEPAGPVVEAGPEQSAEQGFRSGQE